MAGRGVDIKLGGNPEEMAFQQQKIENKLDDDNYLEQKIDEELDLRSKEIATK